LLKFKSRVLGILEFCPVNPLSHITAPLLTYFPNIVLIVGSNDTEINKGISGH